jgi:hypothetical protein
MKSRLPRKIKKKFKSLSFKKAMAVAMARFALALYLPRPKPKFTNTPGGLAVVGERGAEAILVNRLEVGQPILSHAECVTLISDKGNFKINKALLNLPRPLSPFPKVGSLSPKSSAHPRRDSYHRLGCQS